MLSAVACGLPPCDRRCVHVPTRREEESTTSGLQARIPRQMLCSHPPSRQYLSGSRSPIREALDWFPPLCLEGSWGREWGGEFVATLANSINPDSPYPRGFGKALFGEVRSSPPGICMCDTRPRPHANDLGGDRGFVPFTFALAQNMLATFSTVHPRSPK